MTNLISVITLDIPVILLSPKIGQLKASQKLKFDVDDCRIIGRIYVLSLATRAHFDKNSFCPDESYEWTEPARMRKALLKLNRGRAFGAERRQGGANFKPETFIFVNSSLLFEILFAYACRRLSGSGEASKCEKDTCTPCLFAH